MNEKIDNMENLRTLDDALGDVMTEFGKVFATEIPIEYRDDVVRAAALSWLSEMMTAAVQRAEDYQKCVVIEHANNVVRFCHAYIVRPHNGKHPYMPAIVLEECF